MRTLLLDQTMTEQQRDKILVRVQIALCNTAERDQNDILANCASELSSRLETVNCAFGITLKDISATDYQLMQYALLTHGEPV